MRAYIERTLFVHVPDKRKFKVGQRIVLVLDRDHERAQDRRHEGRVTTISAADDVIWVAIRHEVEVLT